MNHARVLAEGPSAAFGHHRADFFRALARTCARGPGGANSAGAAERSHARVVLRRAGFWALKGVERTAMFGGELRSS